MPYLRLATLWLARKMRQSDNPNDYRREWQRRHEAETGYSLACERGSWFCAKRSAQRWNEQRAQTVEVVR